MDDDLRLRDVTIHRFRGFAGQSRKPLPFGDVTLLVGANGHGKTTVFDAIDWALFGDAWRWGKTGTDADVTRGLRSPDQVAPSVTIRMSNGADHTLLRQGSKVTWDGSAFNPEVLCRNVSVFSRSTELVHALRGVTYLPQEHLRALVASESGHRRHLMLAALVGVPFADRFEKNFRNTRDDLDLRRRQIAKELLDVGARKREIGESLDVLNDTGIVEIETLARVQTFLEHSVSDAVAANEALDERLTELKTAESVASAKAAEARRLAVGLEEVGALEDAERLSGELGESLREDVNRRLVGAVEAERRALEWRSQKIDLLKQLGTAIEGVRRSLEVAEQAESDRRSLLALQAALEESRTRLESSERSVSRCSKAIADADAQAALVVAALAQANRELARDTSLRALLRRKHELAERREALGLQRAEGESAFLKTSGVAATDRGREHESRSSLATLRESFQRSLGKTERLTQIIGELLEIQTSDDPHCVVCGHDHGHGATRVEALRNQLRHVGTVAGQLEELAAAEAQLSIVAKQAETSHKLAQASAVALARVRDEQLQFASELETVEAQLLQFEGADTSEIERLAAQVDDLTGRSDASRALSESARRDLVAAKASLSEDTANEARIGTELEALSRRVADRRTQVDEARLPELRKEFADLTLRFDAEKSGVAASSGVQATLSLEVSTRRLEMAAVESSVVANAATLQNVVSEIRTLRGHAGALGVPIDVDRKSIIASLNQLTRNLDGEVDQLRSKVALGENLLAAVVGIRRASRREVLRRELLVVGGAEAGLAVRAARIQRATARFDEIASAVRKAITETARGAIVDAEARINEVLSELCPHQHLNVMRLAEDGELRATDEAGSPNVSPEYYGSTGQLGCMGLSVFLGIALGQSWSKLKVLLLDEPVQNMDDVNFVRFLDLVRRLAETHQVVVSTADKNIGELLERKLRLWADGQTKTALVHRFRAFDIETGPEIVTEEIRPLRAVSA
jgi:DNA repair exonuclease SbcCD ATPase subunit